MSDGLAGRSVIVTGAGAGVGRGVALACASAGAHVTVATRHENGRDVVDEIDARGGRGAWVECDVTDRQAVRNAVDETVARTGSLHAVVHNATSNRSSEPHRLETVDPDLWERARGRLAPRRVPLRPRGVRRAARDQRHAACS